MNDPVDRLLDERQAMDRGLPGGMLISLFAHLMLVGGAFAVVLLSPHEPPLKVMDGFVVPLPPGGFGRPNVEPPAAPSAAPPPAPSQEPAPKPEPPPQVIKPPKPEPRRGLPEPDARRVKTRPEPTPPARSASTSSDRPPGRSTETPGFEFGPPGPGVPGGTDMMGDWYLAGVQRKIWTIWMQQIKANFTQPITVQFTILENGSLEDGSVRIVQPSGVALLDLAAQRAIYNAAPFGPLPKQYGTSRYTIQGIFKPAP